MPWQILPRGSYTPAEDRSTSYNYAADLTAELPITSAAMYILSEDDNLGAGAIHIYEDSEDKLVGTDLLVDIRVYYNSAHVRRTTDISFVHNELQNENGVRFRVSTSIFSSAQLASICRTLLTRYLPDRRGNWRSGPGASFASRPQALLLHQRQDPSSHRLRSDQVAGIQDTFAQLYSYHR